MGLELALPVVGWRLLRSFDCLAVVCEVGWSSGAGGSNLCWVFQVDFWLLLDVKMGPASGSSPLSLLACVRDLVMLRSKRGGRLVRRLGALIEGKVEAASGDYARVFRSVGVSSGPGR